MSSLSTQSKKTTISEVSFSKLIMEFELGALPKEEWTHSAHLLVALWYLRKFQRPEAIGKIRNGIIKYNIASGGENTDSSGYHETLTLFWAWVVESFLNNHGLSESLEVIANKLLKVKLIDSRLPFKYYSRELLFSVKARKGWVEPDLRPPLDFAKSRK